MVVSYYANDFIAQLATWQSFLHCVVQNTPGTPVGVQEV